ncbi:FadR/GntR family transcriptional regulator [Labedella endophytica]|uniref:FadR family transcriptional regulator n=1 Tax=Labedella endophytica TaxID=1523160 RepID=A0A3S0VEJ5_9MICO|nr:GntR family transcriptional regulator [Labedella endophytica]RUQ98976.1 FadR family transcriptional regulator [Labedella endophytica]
MSFTPVQKVNAYEIIVGQIEQAISDGTYGAGDRLPSERALMTDFGVSRATVREAMRVLQATGVIESRPGDPRGPVITAFSPRVLEKSMAKLAQLDSVSRVELLQFRLLLEGQASLLAATERTDDELAEIASRGEDIVDLADQPDVRFGERVNRFHQAIRRASHNQMLEICGNVVGGVMTEMIDRRLTSETDRSARVRTSARDARARRGDPRRARPRGRRDLDGEHLPLLRR